MNKPIYKEEIKDSLEDLKNEILREQRKNTNLILEKIDKDTSEIIAEIFSMKKEIREKIGYQTIILKTLEDNLNKVQFDKDVGISSKIEVSIGGEILGTGAKWVLDIDTGKASHNDILNAIQKIPGIPKKIKEKAKLLSKNKLDSENDHLDINI